jgi:hypothetical protein
MSTKCSTREEACEPSRCLARSTQRGTRGGTAMSRTCGAALLLPSRPLWQGPWISARGSYYRSTYVRALLPGTKISCPPRLQSATHTKSHSKSHTRAQSHAAHTYRHTPSFGRKQRPKTKYIQEKQAATQVQREYYLHESNLTSCCSSISDQPITHFSPPYVCVLLRR